MSRARSGVGSTARPPGSPTPLGPPGGRGSEHTGPPAEPAFSCFEPFRGIIDPCREWQGPREHSAHEHWCDRPSEPEPSSSVKAEDQGAGRATSRTAGPYAAVAVVVPCYNEELTVAKVVADFARALPGAQILVYDNNSTDKTAIIAREPGPSSAMRRVRGRAMWSSRCSTRSMREIYVMVDGDDTYPAAAAPDLIAELRKTGADMVVGVRMVSFAAGSFRRFHQLGNRLVAAVDLPPLLREGDRRPVRLPGVLAGVREDRAPHVPGLRDRNGDDAPGARQGFVIREVPIAYGRRPEGSHRSSTRGRTDSWS